MPELTAWGGINEIGGNKFLLTEGDISILLDFGMTYEREGKYFEMPFIQAGCLDDYFKTGILPKLNGFYKNAGLRPLYDSQEGPTGINGLEESRGVDGLIITHAHMDHYGYVGLLRKDIPIYASPATCRLVNLRSNISETFTTKICPESLKPLDDGELQDIGPIRVRSYLVDHSIPGATGWIIEAGEVKVGYTGDLRLHGPPEGKAATERFLQALAQERVDYLLCEGTRLPHKVESDEIRVESHALASEQEVYQKTCELIAAEKGLVIYDASPADMGRMIAICRAAREAGRKVAMDGKLAYLALYMNKERVLYPGLEDFDNVHIILTRRKLASNNAKFKEFEREDFFIETFDEGRSDHEKILLTAQRQRRAEQPGSKLKIGDEEINHVPIPDERFIWGPERRKILDNPGQWMIYTTNGPLTCLQYLTSPGSLKGTYIYGKAEPFNQEMEFTFERLKSWLDLAGLKMEYAHTSGHIRENHLRYFLANAGAKCVIPIHTLAADKFTELHPSIRQIPINQPVRL